MASNPEIPSFKNPQGPKGSKPEEPSSPAPEKKEKKEEEKGGGVPLFSRPGAAKPASPATVSGATPALKIRGLSGGPKSLIQRLKQFQKKDLIFIASGLGVLFMAPLAEHFMMSPSGDKSMQPGFNTPGSGLFSEVGPHEPGAGGMAPGGLVGSGSDVITPLNVRDPSALVMAPGSSQVQPPPAATTVAPPPPSPSRDTGAWKDALSAAKAGAEKGADAAKAGAFRAPGNLAGALRGLSALSGGSYGGGPTFNLSAPNASNVPNRGSTGGGLSQVKSAPGYRGVGARGTDSGGNAEALKGAIGNAGDRFNRPGGAANSLEAAAREAIPVGSGTGGGGPSGGSENKGASGSNSKDNKALGESLAYLKMKMEMEKELDLKWSKKKWKEFEFPKMIYEEITKSAIQNVLGKGILEPFAKNMAGMWAAAGGRANTITCWRTKDASGHPIGNPEIFADNDDEVHQMFGGPGAWIIKRCKAGNPPTACTDVMQGSFPICYSGDGKSSGAPPPGSEGPPPDKVPGPAPDPGRAGRQAAQARLDLERAKAYCDQNYRTDGGGLKSGCEGVNKLSPIYDKETGYAKATKLMADGDKAIKEAWRLMNEAVNELKAEQRILNLVRPLYGKTGAAPDAKGRKAVYEAAVEAKGKLDALLQNIPATLDEAGAQAILDKIKPDYEAAQLAISQAKADLVAAVGDDVKGVKMAEPGQNNADGADRKKIVDQKLDGATGAPPMDGAKQKLDEATSLFREAGTVLNRAYTTLKEAEGLMIAEPDTILRDRLARPLARKAELVIMNEQQVLNRLGGPQMLEPGQVEGGELRRAMTTLDNPVRIAARDVQAYFTTTQTVGVNPVMPAAKTPLPPSTEVEQGKTTPLERVEAYKKTATEALNGAGAGGGTPAPDSLQARITAMDDGNAGIPSVDSAKTTGSTALDKTTCVAGSACHRVGRAPLEAVRPPDTMPAPPWPADTTAPPPTAPAAAR